MMKWRVMYVVGGVPFLLAVVTAIRPDAFGTGPVVNVYDASELASLVAVMFGIRRWRPQPFLSWSLIAATIGLWTVGDIVYALVGGACQAF